MDLTNRSVECKRRSVRIIERHGRSEIGTDIKRLRGSEQHRNGGFDGPPAHFLAIEPKKDIGSPEAGCANLRPSVPSRHRCPEPGRPRKADLAARVIALAEAASPAPAPLRELLVNTGTG
jgi:hypothetical protein